MERAGETVYVEDERTGEKSKYVVTSTYGERIILEKVPEDRLTSDYDLIVELSQTVAKLKRRIDALEERAEMNEEDIEKWGRRTVEADYKAGQALTSLKLRRKEANMSKEELGSVYLTVKNEDGFECKKPLENIKDDVLICTSGKCPIFACGVDCIHRK